MDENAGLDSVLVPRSSDSHQFMRVDMYVLCEKMCKEP